MIAGFRFVSASKLGRKLKKKSLKQSLGEEQSRRALKPFCFCCPSICRNNSSNPWWLPILLECNEMYFKYTQLKDFQKDRLIIIIIKISQPCNYIINQSLSNLTLSHLWSKTWGVIGSAALWCRIAWVTERVTHWTTHRDDITSPGTGWYQLCSKFSCLITKEKQKQNELLVKMINIEKQTGTS